MMSATSTEFERLTAQLVTLLAERSTKVGDFVLASGRRSSLYVDCRLTTMSPEGQLLLGELGAAILHEPEWRADAVGGLTLGADPIAYAIAHTSAIHNKVTNAPLVRAFTVRKQPKTHGTGQRIEGPFRSGDRVVVVEDVITTGQSALSAVEAIREAGGVVVGVLAVVDREEGGREALEGAGLMVRSLATAKALVAALPTPAAQ
jgi:orotate phosphoribosyltransferase